MAVGASISMVAPNWEATIQPATYTQQTVVSTDAFRFWLRALGFIPQSDQRIFHLFPNELYVHVKGEEVAFVTIDFGLVDDTLERLPDWERLVQRLSTEWGFSLVDPKENIKVPVDQFRRLLSEDWIWGIISETHGWPPIWKEESSP